MRNKNNPVCDSNVRKIPWLVAQICSKWGEWNDYLTRLEQIKLIRQSPESSN